MTATDPSSYVLIKSVMITIPDEAPILTIDQGLWGLKDIDSLGYLSTTSKTQLTFSSTYTNCVPTDIGKRIRVNGARIDELVLAYYKNEYKIWWLSGSTSSSASIPSGAQITIDNGTGAGTTSAAASVFGGGAIRIGHGFTGPTDVPKIMLTDTEQGYNELYIREANGTTPAHLDLGNLTAHGSVTIGGGTIYWQTATNPDVLEMNCGLIIDGALNVSGVSINGSLGITSTSLVTNLNADMLDGHHWSEVSAWNGGTVTNSIAICGSATYKFGTAQVDGVGAYYPCKITQLITDPSAANSWLQFYVANGNYGAQTEAGRQTLAFALRGDGVATFYGSLLGSSGTLSLGTDTEVSHANTVYFNVNSTNSSSSVINLQSGGSTKTAFGYLPGSPNTTFLYDYAGYLVIGTQNGGDIVLSAGGSSSYNVRLWGGKHLIPQSYESGMVGNSSYPFYASYTRTVYAKYSGTYDAYDDLALVKQWGNTDAENAFSILKSQDNQEYFDLFRMASFSMGCSKALVLKQEQYDAQITTLLNRIETLENQLDAN